jgi:hypothetical protein
VEVMAGWLKDWPIPEFEEVIFIYNTSHHHGGQWENQRCRVRVDQES